MRTITQNTNDSAESNARHMAQQKSVTSTRWFRGLKELQLLFAMALCLMLTACAGYTLTSDSPSVLGDGSKTIQIKGVENPTMYTNLPYIVRSNVRNELTARKLAVWRDAGATDYTMQIRITRLTLRRWAGIEEDTQTIFTSTMGMEFIIYDGKTNNIAWRSGIREFSENLDTAEEGIALEESCQRLTEELLDAMRRDF